MQVVNDVTCTLLTIWTLDSDIFRTNVEEKSFDIKFDVTKDKTKNLDNIKARRILVYKWILIKKLG